jgi:hypothetical protein
VRRETRASWLGFYTWSDEPEARPASSLRLPVVGRRQAPSLRSPVVGRRPHACTRTHANTRGWATRQRPARRLVAQHCAHAQAPHGRSVGRTETERKHNTQKGNTPGRASVRATEPEPERGGAGEAVRRWRAVGVELNPSSDRPGKVRNGCVAPRSMEKADDVHCGDVTVRRWTTHERWSRYVCGSVVQPTALLVAESRRIQSLQATPPPNTMRALWAATHSQ